MQPARTRGNARTVRRLSGLSLLLAGLLLAGCSNDPYASYCQQVEDSQAELTEILSSGEPDALLRAQDAFTRLRDQAPRDIRDDWQQLIRSIESLDAALRAADLDPATYDRKDPPPGLTDEEKQQIDAAARELGSPATRAAFDAVKQQAKDVCHTPLVL